jgi:organic radical activating enzyme
MQYPATAETAKITEIFSSLQGEGTHLGERHLFVRFQDCPMHCVYCDEIKKKGREMTRDAVISAVKKMDRETGPHSCVSLTGGEPLFYLPFLKPLLRDLKALGFRTYLETSGILWKELEDVVDLCDVIAMDMKPASMTGQRDYLMEHRHFLKIAKSREVFVKMVVSEALDLAEFEGLIEVVARTSAKTPVILQSLSDRMGQEAPSGRLTFLMELQRRALKVIPDVRVVPRLHKILNLP